MNMSIEVYPCAIDVVHSLMRHSYPDPRGSTYQSAPFLHHFPLSSSTLFYASLLPKDPDVQKAAVQIGAEALVAEALRFLQVRRLSIHRDTRQETMAQAHPGTTKNEET